MANKKNEDQNLILQRKNFDEYSANINDSRYRKVFRILKSRKKGKFLEIGCSSGDFLEKVKGLGYAVKGLEISEEAARRGRKKFLDIKTGDAIKPLPFPKNYFDVILAGEIIEHTFDDSEFLEKVYKILKPHGTLIITTPNLVSLKNRILMLFGKDPRFAIAPYHYKVYTPNQIRNLFKKSKFKYFKVLGNYVIYSKNREPFLGSFFEWLGGKFPSLAEHYIVMAKK